MTINFKADNRFDFFNILPPGGDERALCGFRARPTPAATPARCPADGDYVVQVYLMRNAARRNEVANYTITIGIGASTGSPEPAGRLCRWPHGRSGLLGGDGVAANDELNIRKGASTKDAIVKGVPNGAILRNKGCKMVDGQRWCAVEDRYDPAVAGWVAGRYLREAGAQAQENASIRCPRAWHQLPCHGTHSLHARRSARCQGLRIRRHARKPGVATIFITVPNGFVRVLSFDNGKVAPQSAVTSFSSSRDQDNTIVKVNGQDEPTSSPTL